MKELIQYYQKLYNWLDTSLQNRTYYFIGIIILDMYIHITKILLPNGPIIPIIEFIYIMIAIPYIHVGFDQIRKWFL